MSGELCRYSSAWDAVAYRDHVQLNDREQKVILHGCKSEWVGSGVPQGLVLGQLLFIIYMNELEIYMNDLEIGIDKKKKTGCQGGQVANGTEH